MSTTERYFKWLCDKVYTEGYTRITYRKLLRKLFKTPFVVVIDNDRNRAEDGIYLRYHFSVETDSSEEDIDIREASVLEVLIALAIRCEEEFMSEDEGRTGLWFWEMISNIGLSDFDDNNYEDGSIDIVLEKFMYRDYDKDGTGCAFRINKRINLENVELWYQLQYYLTEAYYNDE